VFKEPGTERSTVPGWRVDSQPGTAWSTTPSPALFFESLTDVTGSVNVGLCAPFAVKSLLTAKYTRNAKETPIYLQTTVYSLKN